MDLGRVGNCLLGFVYFALSALALCLGLVRFDCLASVLLFGLPVLVLSCVGIPCGLSPSARSASLLRSSRRLKGAPSSRRFAIVLRPTLDPPRRTQGALRIGTKGEERPSATQA